MKPPAEAPRSQAHPGAGRGHVCPQRQALLRAERARDVLAVAVFTGLTVLVFWLLPLPGAGVA